MFTVKLALYGSSFPLVHASNAACEPSNVKVTSKTVGLTCFVETGPLIFTSKSPGLLDKIVTRNPTEF